MTVIARLAAFAFAAVMVAAMTGFSQTNDLKIGKRGEVQLTAHHHPQARTLRLPPHVQWG